MGEQNDDLENQNNVLENQKVDLENQNNDLENLNDVLENQKNDLLNDIKNARLQLNRAIQFNTNSNDKNISSQITDLKIIIKQKEKNE